MVLYHDYTQIIAFWQFFPTIFLIQPEQKTMSKNHRQDCGLDNLYNIVVGWRFLYDRWSKKQFRGANTSIMPEIFLGWSRLQKF